MVDWLRQDPRSEPVIELGGASLPIVIRRLPQARRMTLRLAPDGSEVRISMPRWGRTADALAFAETRRDWIARQLAALPRAEPLSTGSTIRLRGTPLALVHDAKAPRRPIVADGNIRIGGPANAMVGRLRRWLQDEARRLLADDLAEYCARAGKEVPALTLSNAQRRWGSCAPDGAIRINWRLVMAPDFVRRSVVAHEVAHLIHFDHSHAFHMQLAALFEGDIDAANTWLKREGRGLYLPFG